MTRLMQTASALTLAAALAGMPVLATAQQQATETETQAEQAVEGAAQEAGEAIEGAAQEVGQAVEGAAQETEQAVEGAAAEAGQETQEIEVEVEQTTTTEGQDLEQPGGAVVVEAPVEEVEGTIVLQDEDSMLTSDLLDATVYNAQGEKVGEIDDAIVSLSGTVDGVVIGVGGFLGIGEKHVAVDMQQLSIQMDENNQPQLIIDTTKEALEAAPEFVTAETQRREEEQQQMQQQAPGTEATGGMLTSDPAQPGMTPAEPAAEGEAPAQPAQD